VASGVREVELLSDSRYVIGGMSSTGCTGCTGCTGWAHAAAEREWRTTRLKPLANRELWERLLELDRCLAVSWRHVRGHRPKADTSDDARYNREVDALAVEARRGFVVPTPRPGHEHSRCASVRE
jgi:ribonuclease HI